ncbi:MAG: transcription antitermination factor NusB [Bacteroidetes bacterium]|nr:MAG: transcription antitermination factor NusB [Bacteroidota bacterium]
MLNRRHLRVKVLQSLYAFFQSGNTSLNAGEKELLFGIERIYDMYLYQLGLLIEINHQVQRIIDENRVKRIPTQEDLTPNKRFLDNECLQGIVSNKTLQAKLNQRKISWNEDLDIPRKIFIQFRESNAYKEHMEKETITFDNQKEIILRLLKNHVCEFELLHHFYEEKSIYWLDDWELINKMIIKSIKAMNSGAEDAFELMNLYKEADDKKFAIELFHKTILNDKEFAPMIAAKTQNWDIDRIALMDIIIMKMALTEIIKFPEIPVKVSLNEYIELSKMYSTPKSKIFVNGILDKLVEELISNKTISKHTNN